MNGKISNKKFLDLVRGRETPESWWSWWHDHETELGSLLSPGEFLKSKPRVHGFSWVPAFDSQKGAVATLERKGVPFETSSLYQERYLEELDLYRKEQRRVQREKQKGSKTKHPELFSHYPKFPGALAKILDTSDKIKPVATEEQIRDQESVSDFTLPSQVREFFLPAAGIQVSIGAIITFSGMFDPTIHGKRHYVLGELWKEADGDQLLLRPEEKTIWYYAHEQDRVKRLYNGTIELLKKKLAKYLSEN